MQYLEGGRVNLRSRAAWFLYCILFYTEIVTRAFKIKVSHSKVTACHSYYTFMNTVAPLQLSWNDAVPKFSWAGIP